MQDFDGLQDVLDRMARGAEIVDWVGWVLQTEQVGLLLVEASNTILACSLVLQALLSCADQPCLLSFDFVEIELVVERNFSEQFGWSVVYEVVAVVVWGRGTAGSDTKLCGIEIGPEGEEVEELGRGRLMDVRGRSPTG